MRAGASTIQVMAYWRVEPHVRRYTSADAAYALCTPQPDTLCGVAAHVRTVQRLHNACLHVLACYNVTASS